MKVKLWQKLCPVSTCAKHKTIKVYLLFAYQQYIIKTPPAMGTKETFRYTAVYIDFKGSTETKITKYI
jgi:hypothetical protein